MCEPFVRMITDVPVINEVPVITAENATKLVHLYFKSKQMILEAPAPSKFCIVWGNDNYLNSKTPSGEPAGATGQVPQPGPDAYNIYWAIRLLAEGEKYDSDDIEYHVKHNPIFAEINAGTSLKTGTSLNRLNQVHLLRSAINSYKREAEKMEKAEKKALAEAKDRAAYIDATVSASECGRLKNLILIGSKL
jgi:hypothetical protein